MRAAIYARVSSAAQRERDTIDSQLRTLRAYVKSQGWASAGEYVDDGRTAKTGHLDEREGFAKLVRDADAKLFDLVVVVDIDRLTRTDSIEERAQILGPFQRNGVDIVTPSGGRHDLRSMFGQLWATFDALRASEENRVKSERVRNGKIAAAQRGGKPGDGPYWLAYDRESARWAVEPERAAVVADMFERVAAGESCTTVAIDLVARGIASPWRSPWSKGRVRDYIRSRAPVGEWIAHRKTRTVVAVPAIVTEELWQEANAALDRNRTIGLRRTRHVYLLEGLAVCGACGSPMRIRTGSSVNRAASAYICAGRQHWRRSDVRRPTCDAPWVRTADADARAWARLCEVFEDQDLPAELAAERAEIAGDARDWKRDADGYREHLARLDRVAEALLVRFRRGTLTEPELDRELAAINRERAAVRAQLSTAERARGTIKTAHARLGEASAMIAQLRSALAGATPEERREILASIVEPGGVRFRGDQVRIELWIKRPAGALVNERSRLTDHESSLRIRLVA
jgi:site-specific DNA recombinase